MSIFKSTFVAVVILFSSLNAECDNNSLADYNEDNILDILDMVVLVEQIMTYSEDIDSSDINADGIVDVLDVIKLILKILNPYPSISEITYLDYSNNVISIHWEENSSPLFKEYQLLMSTDFENQIVVKTHIDPHFRRVLSMS